ncbi:MAG TPA: hypothetical protein VML55_25700 [Planctomycetaceae bacterium]|nr:hypothetical protein [Planctomycetaceae bacterium]
MAKSSRKVKPKDVRDLFNREQFWEKVQKGELVAVLRSNRHPSKPRAPVPHCTRSQILTYHDPATNKKLAMVHQYLQPDGTLGASGRPDPKFVVHNGIRYHTL